MPDAERDVRRPGQFQAQQAKPAPADKAEHDHEDVEADTFSEPMDMQADADEVRKRRGVSLDKTVGQRDENVGERFPRGDVESESQSLPGVTVDQNTFVVLTSRLGRRMVALPKINPNDASETTKYHVPDAYERGEIITVDDIVTDAPAPGYRNNLERLLRQGAIARMDHPEAADAVSGLRHRRLAEERSRNERGVPRT